MKQESKHKSGAQEQLSTGSSHQAAFREFSTTEELLRHDAAKTDVPPVIAERLSKSVQGLPAPSRSWWQRIFNR